MRALTISHILPPQQTLLLEPPGLLWKDPRGAAAPSGICAFSAPCPVRYHGQQRPRRRRMIRSVGGAVLILRYHAVLGIHKQARRDWLHGQLDRRKDTLAKYDVQRGSPRCCLVRDLCVDLSGYSRTPAARALR